MIAGLPLDFIERFERLCPPSLLADAAASFTQDKSVSFRLNRLHPKHLETLASLDQLGISYQPVDWAHQQGILAYTVAATQREQLTHSLPAATGELYIQSLSSMLAPLLLAPQSDEWVLDLAAAPGGKTILMAEMMKNGGKISAVEPVKNRFFRLQANLERLGVTNTKTYMKDGRAIGTLKPDTFDRVMLDAPCSSESRFDAHDPESVEHWSLRKVAECSKKQKRLILSGFDALKTGGIMMYCTCSFSPEENEIPLSDLLKKRPNAHVLPITLDLCNLSEGLTEWEGKALDPRCALSRRVWPNAQMDGFFLALIQKT